jgi:hypothetical protein
VSARCIAVIFVANGDDVTAGFTCYSG